MEGEKRGRGICVTLFRRRAGKSLSSQAALRRERQGRGKTCRDKRAIEYGGGMVGRERLPGIRRLQYFAHHPLQQAFTAMMFSLPGKTCPTLPSLESYCSLVSSMKLSLVTPGRRTPSHYHIYNTSALIVDSIKAFVPSVMNWLVQTGTLAPPPKKKLIREAYLLLLFPYN